MEGGAEVLEGTCDVVFYGAGGDVHLLCDVRYWHVIVAAEAEGGLAFVGELADGPVDGGLEVVEVDPFVE